MTSSSHSYQPYWTTGRPGGKPAKAPRFRVTVHRKMYSRWSELAERVGIESAQQFWDHVAMSPDKIPTLNNSCILRGKAGKPVGPGWSNTIHYEVSSMARIDYQFNKEYVGVKGDKHPVVRILAINYSSH